MMETSDLDLVIRKLEEAIDLPENCPFGSRSSWSGNGALGDLDLAMREQSS